MRLTHANTFCFVPTARNSGGGKGRAPDFGMCLSAAGISLAIMAFQAILTVDHMVPNGGIYRNVLARQRQCKERLGSRS